MKNSTRLALKSALAAVLTLAWIGCQTNQPHAEEKVPVTVAEEEFPASIGDEEDAEPLPPLDDPSMLPGQARKIIELAHGGVSEDVLLTYIQGVDEPFNLSADMILYLRDIGLSDAVVQAMIRRDQALEGLSEPAPEPFQPVDPAPQSSALQGPAPEQVTFQEQAVAAPAPTTQTEVTYEYFYDSLSPYGSWVEVPGYGRCWRPSVSAVYSDWRPYCDNGRWIWTNHGWYWQSDYSWGWAPFHYGRWFHHRAHGWMWTPDLVWGPSWVSWRWSDSYCGWAPIPPTAYYHRRASVGVSFSFGISASWYSFVPTRRFCDPYPWRYSLSRPQVVNVINNTTVINNYVVNNNTIINRGIPPERIREITRTEVPKAEVREIPRGASAHLVRPDRIARSGNDLVVYRPSESGSRTEAGKSTAEPRRGVASTEGAPRRGTAVTTLRPSQSRGSASSNNGLTRMEPSRADASSETPFKISPVIRPSWSRSGSTTGGAISTSPGSSVRGSSPTRGAYSVTPTQRSTITSRPGNLGERGGQGSSFSSPQSITTTPSVRTPANTTPRALVERSQQSTRSTSGIVTQRPSISTPSRASSETIIQRPGSWNGAPTRSIESPSTSSPTRSRFNYDSTPRITVPSRSEPSRSTFSAPQTRTPTIQRPSFDNRTRTAPTYRGEPTRIAPQPSVRPSPAPTIRSAPGRIQSTPSARFAPTRIQPAPSVRPAPAPNQSSIRSTPGSFRSSPAVRSAPAPSRITAVPSSRGSSPVQRSSRPSPITVRPSERR